MLTVCFLLALLLNVLVVIVILCSFIIQCILNSSIKGQSMLLISLTERIVCLFLFYLTFPRKQKKKSNNKTIQLRSLRMTCGY